MVFSLINLDNQIVLHGIFYLCLKGSGSVYKLLRVRTNKTQTVKKVLRTREGASCSIPLFPQRDESQSIIQNLSAAEIKAIYSKSLIIKTK